MKREEFKELFLNNEDVKKNIKNSIEGDKVVVYYKLKTIYNQAINAFRPSLNKVDPNYAAEYKSYVTEIGQRAYEEAGNINKDELLDSLKENKLLNFIIEKKIPFNVEIDVLPSKTNVFGVPHHFNVYAKVTLDMEYLYLYYGQNYKRKVYLFTKDGVLELKYPPYNLQDDVKDMGITPKIDGTLEIVE